MSYFLFGTISPKRSASLERAQQSGIYLRTQLPKPVAEMLRLCGANRESHLWFLVVAKPSDDTSDSMISPFEHGIDEICSNLGLVQKWLEWVASEQVAEVNCYLTEGYDDHFRSLAVRAGDFQHELSAIIRTEADWPSLALRIMA